MDRIPLDVEGVGSMASAPACSGYCLHSALQLHNVQITNCTLPPRVLQYILLANPKYFEVCEEFRPPKGRRCRKCTRASRWTAENNHGSRDVLTSWPTKQSPFQSPMHTETANLEKQAGCSGAPYV